MDDKQERIDFFNNLLKASIEQIVFLNEIEIGNDIIEQIVQKINDNIKLNLDKL